MAWVSVDQLPNKSMAVKWICSDGLEDVGFYNANIKEFVSIDLISINQITHYKPLTWDNPVELKEVEK